MKFQNRIGRLVVSAILVCFGASALQIPMLAQTSSIGNLVGFVYKDDGKKPCKNCVVILQPITGDQKARFKSEPTNEAGDFRITNIPAGNYKAAIKLRSGKTFYPLSVVIVTAGRTSTRSFYLMSKNILGMLFPCGLAVAASGTAVVLKLTKKKDEEEVSPTVR